MITSNTASAPVVAAFTSYLTCVLIILTQRWHGRISLDGDMKSVQKFHTIPVPRVGGLAVMLGMSLACLAIVHGASYQAVGVYEVMLLLLLAALPAFGAGLVEDATKNVSVRVRLGATLMSALLGSWLIGATLMRVDVHGVDTLLVLFPFIAIVFTAVAVAGVANSINLIDGFHGLAASTVIIILLGLGYLARGAGDQLVAQLAMTGAAATFGFLLLNYPTGRIFLGDGGAYLAGFWVAEVAILLIVRNPSISAWQALAVCAFPVIEALFSIYRRRVLRNVSPTLPDKLHMHQLIYRRFVWKLIPRDDKRPWLRNAMVACVLASWIGFFTILAVRFGSTTSAALLIIALYVAVYLLVYARLVCGRWRFFRPRQVLARGRRRERSFT